ncbi:glucan 1,3-beta-glucosidase [Calycina marina]|uniref:glucan 1,3-beta-glucosidase n=1 Tax=Calycina marina TaxID=1763456 RepID=A0A9P8CCD8_9HELO|nr:glucan 1,3-beta-glucosidase [Calycina marina]
MVFAKALAVVTACLSIVDANPLKRQGLAFDFDGDKVRGVNLGGWFVLEPWITPSLFEGGTAVDEYTFTQNLGKDAAQAALKAHWGSWISEADFTEMARFGLNHARIPIGYWALAPLLEDPYVQGQLEYLDAAIGWARTAGIKVMLDLHGAPLSQNGFDNSGNYGSIGWGQGDSYWQTVNAIRILAERYASQSDVVTSIELLNEPANWGLDVGMIKQYVYDGWGTVRDSSGTTAVVMHDAFLGVPYWNGFANSASGLNNIILDTHIYQVFSPGEVARTPCEHIKNACSNAVLLAGSDKWTIVGEWTGAQTDCAKWLNGFNKGARYDGTFPDSSYIGNCQNKYQGTVDGMLDVDKTNLEYFIEAQLDAYEAHSGWVFWAWKTESAPEWHFQNLTRAGLIPQPLTSRKHPNQCSTACHIPS